MLGLTEFLLIAVALMFLAIRVNKPKTKNLPPGPRPLPIVGNIFQLKNKAHLKMAEWAKQYGKMYTVQLGSNTAIIVNDLKLIKEMLFDSNFTPRPDMPVIDMFSGGKQGIIMTNGVQWEEQRRWTLRKLRDYGFGKTSMEGIIMDEANEVVEFFKKNGEKPIIVTDRFNVAVLNSLWTLLTGQRVPQEDPKIRAVLKAFHAVTPAIAQSGLIFAPWLKYIYPGAQKILEVAAENVMGFSREAVAQHFATHKDETVRDFIDEYITEIKSTTDPASSFYKNAGRKNLEGAVSDLIQAGSETSSNTISWVICYLSRNKDLQRKLHEELDSIIGNRGVTLSDKPNLPYTEAVILETLRHSSLVAGGVQHCAENEKEVNGYTIPKGAWIMANIYFVHHDEAIWGDPQNFRPERFLSSDGKKVIRNEALIPFQMGRRQCLGESLARDTLSLFTATIFQNFEIDMVENCEPEPENGLFLIPQSYHFIFKSRGGK